MTYNSRRRNQRQLRDRWTEQEGRCFYCEVRTWLWEAEYPHGKYFDQKLQATREHLVRQVDGGTNENENIVMACADCNSTRNEHTADEWIALKEEEARKNFESGPVMLGSYREK